MQEIWKDIQGYEGLYQVSNLGNIRSLSFGPKNIKQSNITKLLKSNPTNTGYYKIQLYKNHSSKMFYVHRLVAIAFIPNPENKNQVNHIDGDKSHNEVSNLEWVNASENQLHAIKTGLHAPNPNLGKRGKELPNHKTILQYSKEGKFIKEWDSIASVARFYNCGESCISNCVNNRHKTSQGFIWTEKTSSAIPQTISPVKAASSRSRKVVQYDLDGTYITTYPSIKTATNAVGGKACSTIINCCQGTIHTAYGYKWKYV